MCTTPATRRKAETALKPAAVRPPALQFRLPVAATTASPCRVQIEVSSGNAASDLVQGHGLLWCTWATQVRRRVAVVRIWSHEAAAATAAMEAPTAISHLAKVSAFTVDLLFKRARSVYSGGLSDLGASQCFSDPPPHAHELWCAVFISA